MRIRYDVFDVPPGFTILDGALALSDEEPGCLFDRPLPAPPDPEPDDGLSRRPPPWRRWSLTPRKEPRP